MLGEFFVSCDPEADAEDAAYLELYAPARKELHDLTPADLEPGDGPETMLEPIPEDLLLGLETLRQSEEYRIATGLDFSSAPPGSR
jgi:hypothetical protein